MNWIQFLHSERVIWLLAVFAVVLFALWKTLSHTSRLNRFVSQTMQERLVTRPTMTRQILKILCLAVSGVVFVLALMQPQVVKEEHVVSSRDAANIFIALDVSKSMLATDVAPDRLGRAKSEIRDMLPSFSTHNVGLIAFAGRPTVLSPLTMDHGFFRLALDSASPTSVTLGGTNLGDVIRKGTALLSAHEGPKVMILISDGEDHDSYPLEAAEEARRAGVVIVTVGFGSESGAPIDVLDKATGRKKRITDSNGMEVISKLDVDMLTKIALKTNGAYVPAQTGVLDLEDIMNKLILPLVDEKTQSHVVERRVDLYPWFVAFGLLIFAGFMLLEGGRLRSSRQSREKAA